VRVGYEADALTIEVADSGAGTGADPGADHGVASGGDGHGVAGMAERVAALGGEFTAGPRPGGGFAVTARLPLAGADRVAPVLREPGGSSVTPAVSA
jgi:signal transduction histidine kinase